MFFFRDFNAHHKDWLTYPGGTGITGELSYNFSISNDLIQMINFPTLLDFFLSSDARIFLAMVFSSIGKF